MELKHDVEADAIYIYLSPKAYAYGKDLDNERRIDYAADGTPIGVELLCVSEGVNVDGLLDAVEIVKRLEAEGIKTYKIERHSATKSGYSIWDIRYIMAAAPDRKFIAQFPKEAALFTFDIASPLANQDKNLVKFQKEGQEVTA